MTRVRDALWAAQIEVDRIHNWLHYLCCSEKLLRIVGCKMCHEWPILWHGTEYFGAISRLHGKAGCIHHRRVGEQARWRISAHKLSEG